MGQDRRPGRRRRRAGAGARRARRREVETPVDVFLPRYRGVPGPGRRVERHDATLRVPDPRAPSGSSTGDRHRRPGRRLPAAPRRPPGRLRSRGLLRRRRRRLRGQRVALRAVLPGRPGGAPRRRPPGRRPPPPRLAHGPGARSTATIRYADDPIVGGAADPADPPQPRLPRLDAAGPASASSAWRRATASSRRTPTGSTCCSPGIERAELVNTVSPGFAAEALTPAFGMGLDGALRAKGDRFLGILNGLDTTVWDPATDADLAAPYSRGGPDRQGRLPRGPADAARVRPGRRPGPVIGMIGRLDPQKGFDLLAGAAPDLLERGVRLVVQGSGHPALADPFRAIAAGPPATRSRFIERFDRVMARRIYAGADFFAMPSRFEPCGQGQMIALRYGTPPIVHRVGGLADTVVDEDDAPGRGDRVRVHRRDRRGTARRVRCGGRPARGRRAGVGGAARSRDGGRFRLGHGRRAALRRRVSAGRRDPWPPRARQGGPGGVVRPSQARRARRGGPPSSRPDASAAGRAAPGEREDVVGADPCREPGEDRASGT